MSGNVVNNSKAANSMAKTKWYVCPACGNVIHAMGDAVISCCGITLPRLEEEKLDEHHNIKVERIDDEYVVSMDHPMDKDHFLYFIAYRTDTNIQVERLYLESEALCHFKILGHLKIFAYCNHHGLFMKEI